MGLVGNRGFLTCLTSRPGTVFLPRGMITMVPGDNGWSCS